MTNKTRDLPISGSAKIEGLGYTPTNSANEMNYRQLRCLRLSPSPHPPGLSCQILGYNLAICTCSRTGCFFLSLRELTVLHSKLWTDRSSLRRSRGMYLSMGQVPLDNILLSFHMHPRPSTLLSSCTSKEVISSKTSQCHHPI